VIINNIFYFLNM